MRLTTKGQVTIPRDIREYLAVAPHDEVDFIVKDGQVILVKSDRSADRFREHLKKTRGRGTVGMSTDEIMRLTRGE